MEESDRRAARWAGDIVRSRWRGSGLGAMAALEGDASTRRFWRASVNPRSKRAPSTAIVIDLGPDDLPLYARALRLYPEPLREPPWVNVHRFLAALEAPVPELYGWSPTERLLLVEDVGSLSLREAARANPGQAADLYRDAIKELMRLHAEGTAKRSAECVAFRVAYDERLFAWEMRRFSEFGVAAVAPHGAPSALEPELKRLADELGRLPRVFSHRDFHGNNLFVQDEGRIRIIDFQDALMAPAAQDLAVLITTRDAIEAIPSAIEQKLLDFYFTGMLRRGVRSLGHGEFLRSYWLCVLQHALKCIGLFIFLEREGRQGYSGYVPYAIAQARRALASMGAGFPHLREALTG